MGPYQLSNPGLCAPTEFCQAQGVLGLISLFSYGNNTILRANASGPASMRAK